VRFAATLIVLMLVWTAPVSGYEFSYSKWLELPYDVRVQLELKQDPVWSRPVTSSIV